MTDTDAGKMLSDAELENIRVWLDDIARRYTLKDSERHCAALLSHIAAITANRGSVSEERIAKIIQNSLGRHLSVDDDKEIDGTGPASYEAARAIQQAASECSGGGAEEMREAAAALVERGTCNNPRCWCAQRIGLANTIRALPLPPSPALNWEQHALKDVIVGALLEYSGTGQGVDDMLFDIASGQADQIIEAMKKFGHLPSPVKESRDAALEIPKTVTAYEAMARLMEREGKPIAAAIWQSNADALKTTPHQGGERK